MPRDTLQQSSSIADVQAAAPDHDLDAEHDPARARRLSNALLRREAAKATASKAAPSSGQQAPGNEAELMIKEPVVPLGTGSPRDQIQEAVTTMGLAWNRMADNLTAGVERLADTVQHAQLRNAEPGFMEVLWSKAEVLVSRAATYVSGTPLASEIGLAAIKKITSFGEAVEQARIQEDQSVFIRQLRSMAENMKLEGVAEGGNVMINRTVSKLDGQFIEIGKVGREDAYKRGDNNVVGAQATFLKDLVKRSEDYATNVPSKDQFASQFLLEFVNANHKKRKSSAIRSPFEGSTHEDGYIELNLSLHHDGAYSGWFIGSPLLETATLHCPKSAEVAQALTEVVHPFSLDELDIPIAVDVHVVDSAWEQLPERWKNARDHRVNLRNGMAINGEKDWWQWMLQETRQSARGILAGVMKLKG